MKVAEMELLVRVAESGSMTLAARQMHLTPAAVSATVRRIEEALGLRLFERTTRSIHPTDEGRLVLDGCLAVVERWQQTLDHVQGASPDLSGTVHIAAPADTTYAVLAPVIAEMSEQHPRLQVVVHSSDAVQHLHREAIDMAIRYGRLSDSTLAARKLVECPGLLVASPDYVRRWGTPATPADLVRHRCLTLQLASVPVSTWRLHGPGGRGSVDVALESPLCGDGYLVRRWALAGVGIARKSLFDIIDDLEAGRLVRVLPGFTIGDGVIHMVFPSRRFLPARVRAVDVAVTAAFEARTARCDRWIRGAERTSAE